MSAVTSPKKYRRYRDSVAQKNRSSEPPEAIEQAFPVADLSEFVSQEFFAANYVPLSIIDFSTSSIVELKKEFSSLADQWEAETWATSLIGKKTSHPKYREIVEMGFDVVPFILDRLKRQGGFWFGALYEITGVLPFSDEEAGNRERMTAAWIRWGNELGLC